MNLILVREKHFILFFVQKYSKYNFQTSKHADKNQNILIKIKRKRVQRSFKDKTKTMNNMFVNKSVQEQ